MGPDSASGLRLSPKGSYRERSYSPLCLQNTPLLQATSLLGAPLPSPIARALSLVSFILAAPLAACGACLHPGSLSGSQRQRGKLSLTWKPPPTGKPFGSLWGLGNCCRLALAEGLRSVPTMLSLSPEQHCSATTPTCPESSAMGLPFYCPMGSHQLGLCFPPLSPSSVALGELPASLPSQRFCKAGLSISEFPLSVSVSVPLPLWGLSEHQCHYSQVKKWPFLSF